MRRKSTQQLPYGSKRAEMYVLEKELRKEGYRPPFWKTYGRPVFRGIVIILLLAAIAWSGNYIWQNYVSKIDALSIHKLEFKSNGVIGEKQVLKLMGYDPSVNIVTIDTAELEKKLKECSSIKAATVQRKFPSTLVLNVDARIPVAWVHCPGCGVRSYDLERGMFVDADGVVFSNVFDIYENYRNVPALQVPTPDTGEIKPGQTLADMKSAIALIIALKQERKEVHSGVRLVKLRNEWSYIVEFDDGSQAVFGLYDIKQKVDNYYTVVDNAIKTGRKVKQINLLPDRNIPVVYDQGYENIPIAEPVE